MPRLVPGILVVLVLFGLPLVLGRFHVSLLTEMIVFALYGVSYNLLLGYGNLLSFGHALFFGLGAYTTAVALNYAADIKREVAIPIIASAQTTGENGRNIEMNNPRALIM